jgi:hypothetical protein
MRPTSERDLVLAATAGDRRAFGQLVERYQCLVCAVTIGITRDADLSEDLGQETFLAAWRGLPELRDWRKFRPWLCGIIGWVPQQSEIQRRISHFAVFGFWRGWRELV